MARKRQNKFSRSTRDPRKPRSAVSLAPSPWDFGATGPANRAGLEIEDAADIDPETGEVINPNNVKRARRVDMLGVWHRRGWITTAGFNAAEALRDAFEATQRAPGWPDNDRVQSSPKPDHAVTIQIDRLSRYHAVARLIITADMPIITACVLDRGGPDRVRNRSGVQVYIGETMRDGYKHLADALDRLAKAMGA